MTCMAIALRFTDGATVLSSEGNRHLVEMTGGKWFRDLCNKFPGDNVLTSRMYLDGTPASNPLGGVSSKPLVMAIGNFDMDLRPPC
jgi:hypothetical protein